MKDTVWDDAGNRQALDFERMLRIVLKAGYRGYCGIEFGGFAGLRQSRERLELALQRLQA